MKAALFRDPGKMDVGEVVAPDPAANEVVVGVAACGVCGSDLHLWRTNAHRQGGLLRIDGDGNEIPGHEYAGIVTAVGSAVENFAVGDRVVGVTAGGGMAELVPVPVNPFQIAPIPEGVGFDEAATTEPLADALQMVRLAEIAPGENVMVIGVGIIGLGVIQAIRARGIPVGRLIAVDVSAPRLDMALRVGATDTINPRETDLHRTVADLCGVLTGDFKETRGTDLSVIFDCAGYVKHMRSPPPLQTALDLIKPRGGRIICFGAYEGQVTLDLTYLIQKQPRIIGSLGYAADELGEALALMAAGKVDRKMLISHHFPLDGVVEAFETSGSGQAIKVLVKLA